MDLPEGLTIDPNFLDWLLPAVKHHKAKKKRHCSVCNKKNESLYHCASCLIGIYCSVECQQKDYTKHQKFCLVGPPVKKKKETGEEDIIEIPREPRNDQPSQLEVFFNVVDPNILFQIITVLAQGNARDVLNVRLVSLTLYNAIGTRWISAVPFVINMNRIQIYEWAHYDDIRFLNVNLNEPVLSFPAQLAAITFGYYFNQPVDNLPQRVTNIEFGFCFNQSVDNLPDSVTRITFGHYFDQPVSKWPANVTHITFGYWFNQLVDNLLDGVTHITFGHHFNRRVDRLPRSVTHITFAHNFDQPIDNLPQSVTHITLTYRYRRSTSHLSPNIVITRKW